jgi:hypothetical protein
MPRWLVIALAAAGLLVAAVLDRRMSDPRSGDVRAAAAKLDGIPATFGDWTGTDMPMSEKVLRVAEAAGHVVRTYTNRKNGASVSVLLLCGPTGPIGAHEPQYCYAGNGYEMTGTPQKQAVGLPGGETASYWSVLFEKKSDPGEPPLRVCWAWSADGEWQAAADPRTEYALRKALYKLYVTRPEPRTPTGAPLAVPVPALDPIHEFLTEFLPVVNKTLAGPQ